MHAFIELFFLYRAIYCHHENMNGYQFPDCQCLISFLCSWYMTKNAWNPYMKTTIHCLPLPLFIQLTCIFLSTFILVFFFSSFPWMWSYDAIMNVLDCKCKAHIKCIFILSLNAQMCHFYSSLKFQHLISTVRLWFEFTWLVRKLHNIPTKLQ